MPYGSWAVTVNETGLPAVALELPLARTSLVVDAAVTLRFPVVERLLAASDTVRVCGPLRIRVAEKVPWPLAKVESAGSTTPAEVSLLPKWTVPLYEVTGLPWASSADTLTLKACPAPTLAGATSRRSCTGAGPIAKAFMMLVVACWMRGSGWLGVP